MHGNRIFEGFIDQNRSDTDDLRRIGRFRSQGQFQGDGAAGARVVGGLDAAAHGDDELFYQGQADAGAAGGAGQLVVHPVEIVEDCLEGRAGDAGAGVGDRHAGPSVPRAGRDGDAFFGLGGAEFDAVFDQVDQNLYKDFAGHNRDRQIKETGTTRTRPFARKTSVFLALDS